MFRRNLAGLALVLSASGAHAYDDEEAEVFVDRRFQAGQVDLRVHLETNLSFRYAEPGLAADFALALLEPGTLSLGAELDVGLCSGTVCGAASTPAGSAQLILPSARLAYHWLLTRVQEFQRVDGFVLVTGGPAFATSGAAFGVGGSFSLGGGVSYFIADPLFFGLELRWRFLAGTYPGSSWNLSGLGLRLYLGLRF